MTFYFTYTRDSQAIQLWQNKLLVVAKEARLSQRDNIIRQRAEALAQIPQSQDLIELAKKEWQAYFVTTLPQ